MTKTLFHAVSREVRSFYEQMPFNYDGSVEAQAETIRSVDHILAYPPLARYLSGHSGTTMLDAGCGAGWLALTAAFWYGACCLGVDFSAKTIQRAEAAAAALGAEGKVSFEQADILQLPDHIQRRRFDLVCSLGTLHHTADCFRGAGEVVSLLKPGGYFLLGLYHRYGRKPLLDEFAPFYSRFYSTDSRKERLAIQHSAMVRWNELFKRPQETVLNESWFRDQCLHPHETQWTLKEVLGWFAQLQITPLSTSLDKFSADPDWQGLVAGEKKQEDLARKRLFEENRFFPGFFVVWARKS